MEAACALTYFTSGKFKYTKVLIDHGALPIFVRLLSSPSDDIRKQVTRALFKIVHYSIGCHDLLTLARLTHINNEEVLGRACRTLAFLSRGTNHDNVQTQDFINEALPYLLNLLTQDYEISIKKEACRASSTIIAGNRERIQSVIQAAIIDLIIQLLKNDDSNIVKNAASVISNATSGGTHEQIKFLVSQGCIKSLCDLLVCPNPRIVTVCFEAIENILEVGEVEKNLGNTQDMNVFAQIIDDAEGLEKNKKTQES